MRKPYDFLMFSGGREGVYWEQIGQLNPKLICFQSHLSISVWNKRRCFHIIQINEVMTAGMKQHDSNDYFLIFRAVLNSSKIDLRKRLATLKIITY